MNGLGRYISFLLPVALVVCNMQATSQRAVSVSEPDLRFMKLLNSAEHGEIKKEVEVADGYLIGNGVRQNVQLAAEWYERAANAGNPGAQNQIGYMSQAGLGVPKDPQRAVRWYQLSATNGSISGKVNLAVAYIWGIGVERNPALGATLLSEASQKGSGVAAAYLGDLYVDGVGVMPDINRGIAYYERGAKLHSYYAEYKLAVHLSKPDQHPRDLARSVALLRSSISQGYIPAMYALGLIAVNHPECAVPHQEALRLLGFASDAGSWRASAVLGALARDGNWVAKSPEEAYTYFERAAVQGGDPVKEYVSNDLRRLMSLLDERTVATLNERTTEWARNHTVQLELIHKADQKPAPVGNYALTSPLPGEHTSDIISANPD